MRHHPFPHSAIRLDDGLYERRRRLNRDYLASLEVRHLLQNFYIEAGIGDQSWHLRVAGGPGPQDGRDRHWGWETPGSQLRGHFLGHWLSAVAREVAVTGDRELRARLEDCLDGLARCQRENGGEWIWAIPPKYLDRMAEQRPTWAPQYAMHKTLMGLVDVVLDLGDPRALAMVHSASRWIDRWSSGYEVEKFQRILDVETGGMLEVWADLLELTGDPMYERLLERYWRHDLFDPVSEGIDVLTNMHANTTIPEVLGAARAYEVTNNARWRKVVEEYWRLAVTERGTFCTGGQTSGEIWTPPFKFAARRGEKTQEHCTVYNLIRLADRLFRWTGASVYLEYIERNLINGVLAQQHPATGMVAYFLPLQGGAKKNWGTPTDDFWCCHGTLVQAHTRHSSLAFYRDSTDAIVIAQYVDATLDTEVGGQPVVISTSLRDAAPRAGPDANAGTAGSHHRPTSWGVVITVRSDGPVRLRLRVPDWVDGEARLVAAGRRWGVGSGFAEVEHTGGTETIELTLPTRVTVVPIPDEPSTVAFLEGPTVLAGLVDGEIALRGDPAHPERLLTPDNERQWSQWLGGYRTVGQDRGVRLLLLHEIADQSYSVYFPVRAG